jgi:hypothetical protein
MDGLAGRWHADRRPIAAPAAFAAAAAAGGLTRREPGFRDGARCFDACPSGNIKVYHVETNALELGRLDLG